jgi:hypothetical protein
MATYYMNIKTILKCFLVSMAFLTSVLVIFAPQAVFADSYRATQNECETNGDTYLSVALDNGHNCIASSENLAENPIFTYMKPIIRFLSVGVGLIIVGVIVVSGIMYITSSGDPQKIQSAKGLIIKAISGLLMYIFLWALLNYFIPGGVLN